MKVFTFLSFIFTSTFCFSQNIFPTSGNVGIGTNLPTYKLDIDNGGYGSNQIRWRAFGGQYGYTYSDSGGIGIANSDPYSELIYLQTGNKSLNFYTNSVHRAVIDSNGNFGIGTTNPSKNLDIYGNYATTLKISTGDPSSFSTEIHLGANPEFNKSAIISAPNAAGWYRQDLFFCLANGNNILSTGLSEAAMVIKSYTPTGFGYVGIGTISPDEKLTVKGKIHAQEVRVDMSGPLVPDFVFAEDYKLKSLEEVEDYIKENKHLPEIPSAQEIEKNGLMLAEMNMNLLKKMEEMTLYMIDFKKEMEALKNENKIQEEEIKKLKKQNKI